MVAFVDTTTGTILKAVSLSGGKAQWTTAALPVNAQTIAAVYSGDANYITSTATVAQAVQYLFSGFLAPLNANLSFAPGRAVPIKFQLTDYKGNSITSLSAVASLQVLNAQGVNVLTNAGSTALRYDPTANQFVANWQTKGLPARSYTVQLKLADGTTQTATVQVTANGKGANAQAADGSDVSAGGTDGQLLGGDLEVYVDNSNGALTPDELARIQDAITAVDSVTAPYGVTVEETADPSQAEVTLDMADTSPVGGYADGILGCFDPAAGQITLLQGWDWYAGADPTQVGAGQYDFQTTVTHELGHALGLGESDDPTSAMYGTLAPGTAVRTLTTADLNVPYDESGADAQRAAPLASPVAGTNATATQEMARARRVVSAVVVNTPQIAVSVHDADPMSLAVVRSTESAVPTEGAKGSADHTASTAGVAPAGLPATAAVAEGSLQAVTVAVLARGGQSPVANIGGSGAAIDWTDSAIMPDGDLVKGTAAVDAFFSARLPEGGAGLHGGSGGSARMPADLGDLAWALGLEDGKDTGAVASPVVGNLAAGSPMLFALLGATWGSRVEAREVRRQRRRRQG
jgi:hypothetical protein